MSSAWPRASASRWRYSWSSCSASVLMRSDVAIESSIAFWRLSSASAIRGNAIFASTYIETPKTTSVQIISPMPGETRKLPPSSAAKMTGFVTRSPLEEEGDQARHEAVEEARLGEGEAEPLDRGDLVAHLGLARHGLDDLAEDDADADAGAHGAETTANTEGDRLARVRAVLGGGEDEGEEGCEHWRNLLVGLVVLGDRAAEVDGREGGEDERLQRRDEADLEGEEQHAEREREDAERLQAEQHGEATGHEEDDQVPREDVREETNTQREQPHDVGEELEHEHEDRHPAGHAGRHQRLHVPAEALRADALDVVGDEDDEREDEGDGDVRRRGVDGEGRDLEAEHFDLVLGVGRQRDVADQVREPDEEEEGPDEREPLAGHPVVHVPARDLVAHGHEEQLDRGLHAVGLGLHPLGDPEHRAGRQQRRDDEVEDRLVDVEETELDPRVEPELVLRRELLVVAAGEAEDHL